MRAAALVLASGGAALAACTGGGTACPLAPDLDADDCATLEAMRGASALPPSPTNAHADDLTTAQLGFSIFFDARFSESHTVRCETCHAPEDHFDDLQPVAVGLATGVRNAPSALDAARRTHGFFWDGRADVLWAPPILAMENPLEMGFSRLEIAHTIASTYADRYTAVFGALPALDDATRFPAAGKPGDPAWDAMAAADQDAVNRVAANVGKSLEAYLRHLATGDTSFDRYLDGDRTQLTAHQVQGAEAFVTAGCATCHGGPLLSDLGYHDVGIAPLAGAAPDPGRAAAIPVERAQLFSPDGPYSDDPQPLAVADPTPADQGALRTPSLRNVALTAPYMHNGSIAALPDAITAHASVSADDLDAIVDFLSTLNGDYPGVPWNNWPDTP